MTNYEFIPLGDRVHAARLYMHYTLRQAAEIWGFKQSVLVNWEYNGVIPREPARTQLEEILTKIEAQYSPNYSYDRIRRKFFSHQQILDSL